MDALDTSKLSDRELLLLLHERQSVMGGDVKELKDGTQKELAQLQVEMSHLKDEKADKTRVERIERGQQKLFNYLWFAFGISAALQVIIPLLMKTYLHQ